MSDTLLAAETTVRDIAAKLPGAAEIFRNSEISFCCGGDLSLKQAAEKAGLDLAALTSRLQDLIDRAGRSAPQETPDLIRHILDRYHAAHREELDFLIQLANRVETVHGDQEEAPLGLTETMIALRDELENHMNMEEQILFPAILNGAGAHLAEPIRIMNEDHADATSLLHRIEHLTNGLSLPIGACGSWTALYTGLHKLCDDVVAHIALEETVLFPRAVAV